MLVLLFFGLIKHRGDIVIYDILRDLKDEFDSVKGVGEG